MDLDLEKALEWAANLDRHQHLSLVSSLYGPGAVGAWLAIVCSLAVSWTINKRSNRSDKITNDFLGALTMPAVACGHLIHQYIQYPASRVTMFRTMDPELVPKVAAIEASLCICESFSALALPLAALSMCNGKPKRFFATMLAGLMCFISEVIILVLSPVKANRTSNLSRPPLMSSMFMMAALLPIIGLLVVGALYVWIQYALWKRSTGGLQRDQEANGLETEVLRRKLHAASIRNDRVAIRRIRSQLYLRDRSWIKEDRFETTESLSGLATVAVVFMSILSCVFAEGDRTPIGTTHSTAWRLRFFIPESNVSITELDQVVALAGGMATLIFSCYDAYRSWIVEVAK